MSKLRYLAGLSVAFAVLLAVSAAAQTGTMSGTVKLKQADGTLVPLAGAIVDVYRIDILAKYELKTNKSGVWTHIGLPFVGKYNLAISGPGARPDVIPNAVAKNLGDYNIVLEPGDGHRLTEGEIKQMLAGAGKSEGLSASDKAKIEENNKRKAEYDKEKEKVENANTIVISAYKAANALVVEADQASAAGKPTDAIAKYHEAAAKYDEGINADPSHPGLPSLMINKSIALRQSGVVGYNMAAKTKDPVAKAPLKEASVKDLTQAAEMADHAVAALKAPPADPADLPGYNVNKLAALAARAEAYRLVVSNVDNTKVDATTVAYSEYIAAEVRPDKKAKAENDFAWSLFQAGALDKALPLYRNLIAADPANLEAQFYLGLTLINLGYAEEDKAKQQEGVNFLQAFADKALDTDERKADAKSTIEELKKVNIAPQKGSTGGRRKGN